MNYYIFVLLFFALVNFILFVKLKSISEIINIYDNPDNIRKLHKSPVPLLGGVFLFINFLFIILLFYIEIGTVNISVLIFSCLFFFIGLADDKYNLLPSSKFFFNIIVLVLFFYLNEDFLIEKFKFFNIEVNFNYYYSYFFSTLCVLIFINALNLFDGLNLQTIFYSITTLMYLLYKDNSLIHIALVLAVLVYLVPLNYKNKLFLGDSGVYLLGSFISLTIMDLHNINQKITADEIFVLMMLPGLDMTRLFVQRLLNKKTLLLGIEIISITYCMIIMVTVIQ